MIKPCTTEKWILPECHRKKYGVPDFRYFKNGINIFISNKYNFCLVVCKISTQLKVTKVMNLRRMIGQTVNCTQAYYHYVHFDPSFLASHGHNFDYILYTGLKLYTYLDESYRYHVSKYYIDILHHS